MAIEKRLKKVWNGVAWVEVYHPTSDDLIYVEGGSKTLRTKLGEVDDAHSDHITDITVHTTPSDKSKLGYLADNANATYATKVELGTHADDDVRHWTNEDREKFENIPEDANATFATKAELAGEKKVYFFTDIPARNNGDTTGLNQGDTCWVADASGDTENVTPPGSAKYMWDGAEWQFLFEADANLITNWSDVVDRPDSTVEEIDEAVDRMHSHVNKPMLEKFAVDSENYVTWDGKRVGEKYNRVFLGEQAPSNPATGDLWLPEIN